MCRGERAFFAEGLASSYEAFHHTREERGAARDMADDGGVPELTSDSGHRESETIIPVSWYEEQVTKLIPSRAAPRTEPCSALAPGERTARLNRQTRLRGAAV